jgi:hypothetical protein
MITYAIFFLAGLIFLFNPCSDPAIRMEEYEERIGGPYSNLNYRPLLNRFVPVNFILKRAIFVYVCWYV